MEKKNYFLFIVMTILCLACVDESSLSDSELAAFTAGGRRECGWGSTAFADVWSERKL